MLCGKYTIVEKFRVNLVVKPIFNARNIYMFVYVCISVHIYVCVYLPTTLQDVTQGQFFKRSQTGLNSEFSS